MGGNSQHINHKRMEGIIMKLEEVKNKIDNYFDRHSAEELLQILTEKYGMEVYDLEDLDAIPDDRIVGNAMIA